MSSIEHIHTTPGFDDRDWPEPMTMTENLADLERHFAEFEEASGFTYSILDGDAVIGCVYIYPPKVNDADADVASWVRESRSEMDGIVWRSLSAWLVGDSWPFTTIRYAARTEPGG